MVNTIRVNTKVKAKRILKILRKQNRASFYEEFATHKGFYYIVFYGVVIVASLLFSSTCYAYPKYDAETERLMREAGLQVDYDLDSIMERQDALYGNKGTTGTPSTQKSVRTSQSGSKRSLKTSNDEYKVVNGGGNNSVKVTDTEDELHIYSDTYNNPSNYSKYSYDEFRIYGQDTPANDGYSKDNFDELHIDKQYQYKLWKPDHEVLRLGIDEIRLPNDPW